MRGATELLGGDDVETFRLMDIGHDHICIALVNAGNPYVLAGTLSRLPSGLDLDPVSLLIP